MRSGGRLFLHSPLSKSTEHRKETLVKYYHASAMITHLIDWISSFTTFVGKDVNFRLSCSFRDKQSSSVGPASSFSTGVIAEVDLAIRSL